MRTLPLYYSFVFIISFFFGQIGFAQDKTERDSLLLFKPELALERYWTAQDPELRNWTDLQTALEALLNLGYYEQADTLIMRFEKALDSAEPTVAVMEVKRTQARIFSILLRFSQASDLFSECIHFYHSQENKERLAQTLVNQAEFYRNSGQFELGKNILADLLDRPYFSDLPASIKASAYHRLAALMLTADRDTDSALALSFKSLSFSAPANAYSDMATSYLEIGYIFYNLDDASCISFFSKALKIWRILNYHHYIGNTYLNISAFYLKQNATDQAMAYLDSAQALTRTNPIPGFAPLLLRRKSEVWYKRGDFRRAFHLRDSSANMRADFLREEYDEDIAEANQKFHTEMARADLLASEKSRQIVEQQVEQERWWRNSLLVGFLLLLVLVLVVYNSGNHIKATNAQLRSQSKEIEGKNAQLKSNVLEKETLLREVHHRVKNNLQTISALMELQKINVPEDHPTLSVMDSFLNRVRAMSLVHERLYEEDQVGTLNMNPFLEGLVEELRTIGHSQEHQIQIKTDLAPFTLDIQKSIAISMLVAELISNSFKYAFPMGQAGIIELKLIKKEDKIQLLYRDNGVGLPETVSEGLGSQLIRMFAKQLKATKDVDNQACKGFYLSMHFKPNQ